MADLRLPWTTRGTVVVDVRGFDVCGCYNVADAEAIAIAVNEHARQQPALSWLHASTPAPYVIEALLHGGTWTPIAHGDTPDAAWSRVPEGCGAVRLAVRRAMEGRDG